MPVKIQEFIGFNRIGFFLALIALILAAYGGILKTSGFIRDDRWLIAENPILRQGWHGIPQLLTTGYFEAVMGKAAPIHEYRPLLSLSYLFHLLTTGMARMPMHAANILLHIIICMLFWKIMRRHAPPSAATAGAMLFAVMPIHTEAVSYITSRSELLSAGFMFGAWLTLEPRSKMIRLGAGTAFFAAALLCKEHSLLFPIFFALADWTFYGTLPWSAKRRKVYALLLGTAIGYLILRWKFLAHPFHGGVPYFGPGLLVPALTYSRFVLGHYLWPSLAGVGLCADYSRPLIPDAGTNSPLAWLCLLLLAALYLAAALSLLRRKLWSLWVIGPSLFLLPTCHLIIRLDTLGAERLFYMPSAGLAALSGLLFTWIESRRRGNVFFIPRCLALYLTARRRVIARACLTLVLAYYAGATILRNKVWKSELAYYEAAVNCNPVSAKARSGLGIALLEMGEGSAGKAELHEAIRLDPGFAAAHYNLALEAWNRKDVQESQRLIRQCLELDPSSADAWVLLAVIAGFQNQRTVELESLVKALQIMPWHPLAHFNLGRVELINGRLEQARTHLAMFLKYAPNDPQAPSLSALVRQLAKHSKTNP